MQPDELIKLAIAAVEQRKITRLRLAALVTSFENRAR